jgi:hypothetical protein
MCASLFPRFFFLVSFVQNKKRIRLGLFLYYIWLILILYLTYSYIIFLIVTMTIYNGALKYSVVFICRRTHVLFTLFVFVCDSGVQHILCCYLFVFIHLMYTIFLWTVHFWLPIQYYLTLIASLSFSKVNISNTWKPRNNSRHRDISRHLPLTVPSSFTLWHYQV